MELIRVKHLDDDQFRSIGINLSGGTTNALEICQETLGFPDLATFRQLYRDRLAA